ncbi:MAG: efflux RND transporter periplasmic adaptor subunit, partial [Xanthomonadales bacterium]|nr:efflux RND transporter periplasmic adaptor subunit [Xanthomonadales bacterium]
MKSRYIIRLTILAGALALSACAKQAAPEQAIPQVEVITAQAQDVALTQELVGRLAPTQVAQVRARVAGIVMQRVYNEGSDVKQGDVLFRIDPAPLQATLHMQQAALAAAKATAHNDAVTAKRYQALAKRGVIAEQDLDDATAKAASSAAAVRQAAASVETANLNLSYATVTAPISGRAGRALVTKGALVGDGSATQLPSVQQLDPIYVDATQPVGT